MNPVPGSRYYVNTWSARTAQRLGARVIDSGLAMVVVVAVFVVGPHGRPVAQNLEIVALVTAIESLALSRWGATIGMRALHLRVAVIDRTGAPPWLTAGRRSVPVAWCYAIFFPGMFVAFVLPWALLLSIMLSPQRRGFHDRLSGTLVVQQGAPALISSDDLVTWWDTGTSVVMSAWGRVPDLFDRRRARSHRVDGAWWMAGVIAFTAIASVGLTDVPLLWIWLTLLWIAIWIVDETWWLSTAGATPGHRSFGFTVVDITTGERPSRSRALLRALVLAPFLYLPPLQLILGLWVHVSSLHRGPHDLAARTVVVEPEFVAPSFGPGLFPTWPHGVAPIGAGYLQPTGFGTGFHPAPPPVPQPVPPPAWSQASSVAPPPHPDDPVAGSAPPNRVPGPF